MKGIVEGRTPIPVKYLASPIMLAIFFIAQICLRIRQRTDSLCDLEVSFVERNWSTNRELAKKFPFVG